MKEIHTLPFFMHFRGLFCHRYFERLTESAILTINGITMRIRYHCSVRKNIAGFFFLH